MGARRAPDAVCAAAHWQRGRADPQRLAIVESLPMGWILIPLFLALFGAQLLLEVGLAFLNLRRARRLGTELAPELAPHFPPDVVRRSQDYTMARARLEIAQLLYDATLALALLFSGI